MHCWTMGKHEVTGRLKCTENKVWREKTRWWKHETWGVEDGKRLNFHSFPFTTVFGQKVLKDTSFKMGDKNEKHYFLVRFFWNLAHLYRYSVLQIMKYLVPHFLKFKPKGGLKKLKSKMLFHNIVYNIVFKLFYFKKTVLTLTRVKYTNTMEIILRCKTAHLRTRVIQLVLLCIISHT